MIFPPFALGVACIGAAGIGVSLMASGFTSSGIAAGSIAASSQARIGNVVARSSFAALQSFGALGGPVAMVSIGVVGMALLLVL